MSINFGIEVEDFVDRAKRKLRAIGPAIAVRLAQEAINNTPIGTLRAKPPHAAEPDPHPGELRDSWVATPGDEIPSAEPGSGGMDQIQAIADNLQPGDVMTIMNVAPYYNKIEMGWGGKDRYSPPHPILRGIIARADDLANEVIRQVVVEE